MIGKEDFSKLILDYKDWEERIGQVSNVLHINPFEVDWVEYACNLFLDVLKLLFNEDGVEDITWWLFEKQGRSDFKMWDADGNEIPTETIDDLWELVKDKQK